MKQYESINYYGDNWGVPVIAFDKLDGSNLRFEWSAKRGFYKFGSRNMMIDENHEIFGFAVRLFLKKYSESLTKVFKSKDYRNCLSFVCFAELIGTKSSFGQHEFGNDTFDIVLFDVSEYKRGLIPPKEFVKNFSHTGIPRIVYQGNLNKEFVERVKKNEFNLSEGVICKGTVQGKKSDHLFYCKIKTNDWFQRLRNNNIDLYDQEIKQSVMKQLDAIFPV